MNHSNWQDWVTEIKSPSAVNARSFADKPNELNLTCLRRIERCETIDPAKT